MSDHGDRRKEARRVVMAFMPVYIEQGKLLGYLRDLTTRGAQVNGEKKLEVNTQVTLSIKITEALPGVPSNRLNVLARVARCIAVPENPNSFEIGFEFIEIQPAQKQIIEAILERFHFRHKIS